MFPMMDDISENGVTFGNTKYDVKQSLGGDYIFLAEGPGPPLGMRMSQVIRDILIPEVRSLYAHKNFGKVITDRCKLQESANEVHIKHLRGTRSRDTQTSLHRPQ